MEVMARRWWLGGGGRIEAKRKSSGSVVVLYFHLLLPCIPSLIMFSSQVLGSTRNVAALDQAHGHWDVGERNVVSLCVDVSVLL